MSSEDKWLVSIPLFVMTAMLCLQFYLVKQHELSVWRLGGFGMFSTVHDIGTRHVRVLSVTEQGEEAIEFDGLYDYLEERARVLPSDKNLYLFGRDLCRAAEIEPTEVNEVRVEYWLDSIDFGDMSVSTHLNKVVTLDQC